MLVILCKFVMMRRYCGVVKCGVRSLESFEHSFRMWARRRCWTESDLILSVGFDVRLRACSGIACATAEYMLR